MIKIGAVVLLASLLLVVPGCSAAEAIREVSGPPAILVTDTAPRSSGTWRVIVSQTIDEKCLVLKEDGPELYVTMAVWPSGAQPLADPRGVLVDGNRYELGAVVTVSGERREVPAEGLEFENCSGNGQARSLIVVQAIARA